MSEILCSFRRLNEAMSLECAVSMCCKQGKHNVQHSRLPGNIITFGSFPKRNQIIRRLIPVGQDCRVEHLCGGESKIWGRFFWHENFTLGDGYPKDVHFDSWTDIVQHGRDGVKLGCTLGKWKILTECNDGVVEEGTEEGGSLGMDAAELQSQEDGRDGREVPGDMIIRRVNLYTYIGDNNN